MRVRRSQILRALAILLLAAGTITVQAASLLPDHASDHASHCCVFCHLAHVSMVNPAQAPNVLTPAVTAWFVSIENAPTCREARTADTQPRAPPA